MTLTTEADFHAHLDAHPDDHTARLVFADWLEERDDPRAEGYRALGVQAIHPAVHRALPWSDEKWSYYNGAREWSEIIHPAHGSPDTHLPADWFAVVGQLQVGKPTRYPSREHLLHWTEDVSRQGIEDDAALAFAQLPPARRAELLAAAPVGA